MRIDILTLFPSMFQSPLAESIVKRAVDKGLVEIKIHNLRDWAKDNYGTVDDRPYGGGVGMILKVDVVDRALRAIKKEAPKTKARVVLLTPQGEVFKQAIAAQLAEEKRLILICGHYEGFDERIREHLVDREISIGDYILTGGELPAMVVTETIARLIPGVLEKPEATKHESFSNLKIGKLKIENLLEYPQYTRPEVYKKWPVPEILLSGNHGEIEKWRRAEALKKTQQRRPDLLND